MFWKRPNYRDGKLINGCQEPEVEEGSDDKWTARSCFIFSWGDGIVLSPDSGSSYTNLHMT